MNEAEWFECSEPGPMLRFLKGKLSDRKLRLFACACCRRLGAVALDSSNLAVVVGAELWADGLPIPAGWEEKRSAVEAAAWATRENARRDALWAAASAAAVDVWTPPPGARVRPNVTAAVSSAAAAARAAAFDALGGLDGGVTATDLTLEAAAAQDDEESAQAALLRHIVGNPFQPTPTAPSSEVVVQLARTLADGGDEFALHDALREAGADALAAHFTDGRGHPKGCWALDLLLGKG